jgi:hypothetical protein
VASTGWPVSPGVPLRYDLAHTQRRHLIMTDVLTALLVRLKRRTIRANTKGEVGLASDLLKAVALIKRTVRACKAAGAGHLFGPSRLRLRIRPGCGLDIWPHIFCRRPSVRRRRLGAGLGRPRRRLGPVPHRLRRVLPGEESVRGSPRCQHRGRSSWCVKAIPATSHSGAAAH